MLCSESRDTSDVMTCWFVFVLQAKVGQAVEPAGWSCHAPLTACHMCTGCPHTAILFCILSLT